MEHGTWNMAYGICGTKYELWNMGYGIWNMGYVVRNMNYGIWDMGYGIWDMGYGIWDMGYGICGTRYGIWHMGCGTLVGLLQKRGAGAVSALSFDRARTQPCGRVRFPRDKKKINSD